MIGTSQFWLKRFFKYFAGNAVYIENVSDGKATNPLLNAENNIHSISHSSVDNVVQI